MGFFESALGRMTGEPKLGAIVYYRLTRFDAGLINRRRQEYETEGASPGVQRHYGTPVNPGWVFPLIITNVSDGVVNGQVLLDGQDTYWAVDSEYGDSQGCWLFEVKEDE